MPWMHVLALRRTCATTGSFGLTRCPPLKSPSGSAPPLLPVEPSTQGALPTSEKVDRGGGPGYQSAGHFGALAPGPQSQVDAAYAALFGGSRWLRQGAARRGSVTLTTVSSASNPGIPGWTRCRLPKGVEIATGSCEAGQRHTDTVSSASWFHGTTASPLRGEAQRTWRTQCMPSPCRFPGGWAVAEAATGCCEAGQRHYRLG